MKKIRIVKRTAVDGRITYVIKERHFLFRWWWVDAWVNHSPYTVSSFSSMEELNENLCYFDGTKTKEEIINEI